MGTTHPLLLLVVESSRDARTLAGFVCLDDGISLTTMTKLTGKYTKYGLAQAWHDRVGIVINALNDFDYIDWGGAASAHVGKRRRGDTETMATGRSTKAFAVDRSGSSQVAILVSNCHLQGASTGRVNGKV